jgi:hypothetical protein
VSSAVAHEIAFEPARLERGEYGPLWTPKAKHVVAARKIVRS